MALENKIQAVQITELTNKKKSYSDLKFNLNEIFYSIQGEGTRMGMPFIFIRLQGCFLRCVWCDTPYALDRKKIEKLKTGQEILDEIAKFNCKRIMLTGGEPLEQEDVFDFITLLLNDDYEVVIETNGQVLTDKVDNRAFKIIDFKCPDSKMSNKNNFKNVDYLNKYDEVKFVIASTDDFHWSIAKIKEYNLDKKVDTILFSPVFDTMEPKLLAEMILSQHYNIRMQLQLHKFIWEPNTRGV